nr:replication-associated protein [Sichuan tick-associated circovirus 2]
MPSIQGRYWCFTKFTENKDDKPAFDELIMQYLVYGWEKCPSTGRRHWQGYVEFKSKLGEGRVRALLIGSHISRRVRSAGEAAEYCKKDCDFVEHGEIGTTSQGSRSDLNAIATLVATGSSSIRDVALSNPGMFVQYGRGLTILNSITNSGSVKRWRDVKSSIWYGKTNLNKTRTWFDTYWDEGCYRFQYGKNNDWWDGYNGEKHILFDEFHCQILLSTMLMYLDGYPQRLETKGSFTYAHWETITIISNDDPQTWYTNCAKDKRDAFARRISKVIHFKTDGKDEKNEFKFAESSVGFF